MELVLMESRERMEEEVIDIPDAGMVLVNSQERMPKVTVWFMIHSLLGAFALAALLELF